MRRYALPEKEELRNSNLYNWPGLEDKEYQQVLQKHVKRITNIPREVTAEESDSQANEKKSLS